MLKMLARLKISYKFFLLFCVLAVLSLSLFCISVDFGGFRDFLYYDEYLDPGFADHSSPNGEDAEPELRLRIKDSNKWLTKFVDPLIGTEKDGNMFPGPCLPFGVVKVGFDTDQFTDNNSGYSSDGKITGISHLHLSGAKGVPQYGLVSQFPITSSSLDDINLKDYGSLRTFEVFKVGYSKFGLQEYDITVELTATRRTGFHRYTFPKDKEKARVILDLGHILKDMSGIWMKHNGGIITSVTSTQIKGFGRFASVWSSSPEYNVYFCSQFKTPAKSFATFWSDSIYPDSTYQAGMNSIGAIMTFDTSDENIILSRVGISFISAELACENAETEVGEEWDFEKIRRKAEATWEVELEKVEVHGGNDRMKKIFYSGLYRSMMTPSDRTGENPRWKSYDREGKLIPNYDDIFTLWSGFRTTIPLYTLIQQKRVVDIARSLIDIYHNEGFMPDGRSGMYNSISRGGSNGDMVLSELFLKNLGKGKINWGLGYKAMLKNAFADPWHRGTNEGRSLLRFYKQYGYLPLMASINFETIYREQGVCSKTMEYASNDFAIACVAKGLNKKNDYEIFKRRADYWQHLWNPNVTEKDVKGFITPIEWDDTIRKYNYYGTSKYISFYDGSSWEYSLNVPHDVNMLIKFSGGPEEFEKRLNLTFENKLYNSGYFSIRNIPSLFHPNLYHYIGKQYKSVQIIRDIMEMKFGSGKDGLSGSDEFGVYSCWYIFNAIGIYPIGGQDIYLVNSPHFANTTIHISPTITFSIVANNLSDKNVYIQSAKLNHRKLKNTWFRHSEIAKGGILELEMGDEVSKVWGVFEEGKNGFGDDIREWFGRVRTGAPPSLSDNQS